jgi:hypothetical protein
MNWLVNKEERSASVLQCELHIFTYISTLLMDCHTPSRHQAAYVPSLFISSLCTDTPHWKKFSLQISRQSIDAVKNHFREEMTKPDWQLIVEMKKLFQILWKWKCSGRACLANIQDIAKEISDPCGLTTILSITQNKETKIINIITISVTIPLNGFWCTMEIHQEIVEYIKSNF